ncbi:hypothetical protein JD292_02505 [Leucobacter sp. CSA2]|uniref:PQQ-binding-like beta-propeller repeat protein n=1 Tax=Leucobacter edaphi TaxID=2796472 RepID=A0A934QAS9_9MICO|nr:hypothetical protein [Leucobacter edaphi]MBK0420953.1 hypothetical protein [Leucobacter edaphi]
MPRTRRTAIGTGLAALAAAALLLSGCSGGGPDPSTLKFSFTAPEGGWLTPGYAQGFGTPIELDDQESICGVSDDGTVLVKRLAGPMSEEEVAKMGIVGIDLASGSELWKIPGRQCHEDQFAGGVLHLSPKDIYPGASIAAGDEQNYLRIDPKTGQQIGRPYLRAEAPATIRVLSDEDGAVLLEINNHLVVKAKDGQIEWQSEESKQVEECVYILGADKIGCETPADEGTYRVLDAKTGEILVRETAKKAGATSPEWYTDGYSIGPESSSEGEVSYFDYAGKKLGTGTTDVMPFSPTGAFYALATAKSTPIPQRRWSPTQAVTRSW